MADPHQPWRPAQLVLTKDDLNEGAAIYNNKHGPMGAFKIGGMGRRALAASIVVDHFIFYMIYGERI